MKSPVSIFRRSALVLVVSLLLNFGTFLINYRLLAFPYLSEEQRVSNASVVLTVTLSTFALCALLLASFVFWLLSRESITRGAKSEA